MIDPITVVFDWGGVVLRICRSWEQGCERAGLTTRPDDFKPAAAEARSALAQRYQLGQIDCDGFCDGLSQLTEGRLSSADAGRLHDAWLIAEYPGMAELIARLNAIERVRTALLSNTNAGHWRRHLPSADGSVPDFPAVGTLDNRLGSHLLGQVKPDEAIYRSLEVQTGAQPERIVFFDDLAENVASARGRGWRSEQIDHEGDPAAQIRGHLASLGIDV